MAAGDGKVDDSAVPTLDDDEPTHPIVDGAVMEAVH